MTQSFLPAWPEDALESIGLLYRELQDVEIYVEDEDSEAIYRELLKRSTHGKVKIHKLFCLNGRNNVVSQCEKYDDDSPALFIIDGDLDLITGKDKERTPRLFQHDLYCMENYLFCESAAIEMLMESSGKILNDEASSLVDWRVFVESIKESLENLFITFGAARLLKPSIKTVSNGFYSICFNEKNSQPKLCQRKTDELISKIDFELIQDFGVETLENVKEPIRERVFQSCDSFVYVSGKDYLLPAMYFYLKEKGITPSITMDSFKFRLARHCATEKLQPLAEALKSTALGNIYQAA